MSDLKLLPPNPPTPLERLLLDAAASEAPSPEQRLRVRQALGLPSVTMAPALPGARYAGWLKASLAGAVVVSAALLFVLSGARQQEPRAVEAVAAVTAAPGVVAPAPVSVPVPSALNVEAPPAQAMPRPAAAGEKTAKAVGESAAKAAASSAPATEAGGNSSEQLRLIDAARAAVRAGNVPAASQALNRYTSQFPRGAFGQEASVLRIQTVALQGDRAQAAALARSFLSRHPNSPHVALVQAIAARAQ